MASQDPVYYGRRVEVKFFDDCFTQPLLISQYYYTSDTRMHQLLIYLRRCLRYSVSSQRLAIFLLASYLLTVFVIFPASSGVHFDHASLTTGLARQASVPPFVDGADAFDWNDLDWQKGGDCGLTKCFFHSVSNATVGYLVASVGNYDIMQRASQLAANLTEQIPGLRHLYLETDPRAPRVSPSLVAKLNAHADQPVRRAANRTIQAVYEEDETTLVVQTVIKAPAVTLMFGCCAGTKFIAMQQLAHDFWPRIPNRTLFRHNLRQERDRIERALYLEPRLWDDFQGLVDVHGHFYFIDLDGHFGYSGNATHLTPRFVNTLIRRRLKVLDGLIEQLASDEP
jgi:hypothetical protein